MLVHTADADSDALVMIMMVETNKYTPWSAVSFQSKRFFPPSLSDRSNNMTSRV